MSHPLDGPTSKILRAYEHLKKLRTETETFIKENKHHIVIGERHVDTAYYSLRAKVSKPPPIEWGVVVGEIAHDLRSALDGIVWQLVILNGTDPSTLRGRKPQFPIFLIKEAESRPCYMRDGKPRIHGRITDKQEALIEWLQPYNRPNPNGDALWLLHELNNADKHRLVLGAAAESSMFVLAQTATSPKMPMRDLMRLIRLHDTCFLIDGAEVGVIHESLVEHPEMHPKPVPQISFWEGCDAVRGLSVTDTIDRIGQTVNGILVKEFARYFPP
jgi:hypothetical protein